MEKRETQVAENEKEELLEEWGVREEESEA